MTELSSKTACLVIIGNEILSGRTQDTNLNFLAKGLNDLGIRMREARVIPDVEATIVATINDMRARYDYVFTTGGIGPTHDDITADSIALAFGVDLVIDPEARAILEQRIGADRMNEARLRMARIPVGGSLIANKLSGAPGFQMGNVFVLAGVPAIAQAMFEALKDRLVGGPQILTRTVECSLPEGTIAHDLSAIQDRYPMLDVGSYPVWNAAGFKVSLVLRGTEVELLANATGEVMAMIRTLGGVPVEAVAAG